MFLRSVMWRSCENTRSPRISRARLRGRAPVVWQVVQAVIVGAFASPTSAAWQRVHVSWSGVTRLPSRMWQSAHAT